MQAMRLLAFLLSCAAGAAAVAADTPAAATLDPAASGVVDSGEGIAVTLSLSRPVPYRAFVLDAPPRLVLDLAETDFVPAATAALDRAARVTELGAGPIRPGWSRLVAVLDGPYRIESAVETTVAEGAARIDLRLAPVGEAAFAVLAAQAAPEAARWALPEPVAAPEPKRRQTGDAPLVVVLDPGHGGIDPGAEADGTDEAEVMLGFAQELASVLRAGGMDVVLTREADVFVPLEARISIARAAGADVFLSLHADALAEGRATGATVYLLADEASDAASARLAERHDRADLLAGVDLSRQDDGVALVMMDLARTETQPRADRLAESLAAAIGAAGVALHSDPIQRAAFSVLKSPDIPSVLLEVGFLSSPGDRRRLADPAWRGRMHQAIFGALRDWAAADAAEARLIRQ